jgi:hypothetical protein
MAAEETAVHLLWHRRHALQIAMQLPEAQRDALLVLDAARELVLRFLPDDQVDERLLPLVCLEGDDDGVVLAFVAPPITPAKR